MSASTGRGVRPPGAADVRLAVLLGLTTFIGSYAFTSLSPVLPLYGRKLGATYAQLGALSLWLGLVFAACALPAGLVCDRLGSPAVMVGAVVTGVLSGCCYFLARTYGALIVARVLQALACACFWPSIESLACRRGERLTGYFMGWLLSGFALAGAVGSVVSGWLYQVVGPRSPFVGALLSAALLAPASAVLFREAHRLSPAADDCPATPAGSGTRDPDQRASWNPAEAGLALMSGVVYVTGLAAFLTFAPAYAQSRGVRAGAIGGMVSLYWLGRIAASYVTGTVSDRLGREAVLVPSLLLGAGALAGFVWNPSPAGAPTGTLWFMLAASFLIGLSSGASAPAATALASDAAPADSKGTAMGLFESSCNLGYMAAGWVGGSLALRLGDSSPFTYTAVLSAVWAVAVLGHATARRLGGARSVPRRRSRRPARG